MATLFADENVPLRLVEHLRDLGHDVLTAFEADRANASIPDPEVLAFTAEQGRALLTGNRHHFHKLHRAQPDHAGIITYTNDLDYGALAGRIHEAMSEFSDLAGRLVRVVRPG